MIEEVEDELTGEVRRRYVNRSRFQGFSVAKVSHTHTPGEVPMEPVPKVRDRISKLDQRLLEKLREVSLAVSWCSYTEVAVVQSASNLVTTCFAHAILAQGPPGDRDVCDQLPDADEY